MRTRARGHSLLLFVTLIGIPDINENEGGIMTEGPRLSRRHDGVEEVAAVHELHDLRGCVRLRSDDTFLKTEGAGREFGVNSV